MQQQHKYFGRALYVALAVLATTPAFAVELDNLPEQTADLAAPREPQPPQYLLGSLGVALVNTGRFVGSDERVTLPLPLVYFDYNDRLYWSIASVGTWLVRSDDRKFRLGLLAKARGGIDGDDVPYPGIADRDASVDAGLNLTWHRAILAPPGWPMRWRSQQTANLRLSLPIKLSDRWTTTPNVSAEWMDHQLVDYYYGVTPAETGGGAPLYTGTAAANLRAGWSLSYRINRNWRVLGGLSYTRLGAGIADSPLVSESDNLLAYAGFTWTFGHVH
jgi:outer membrane scaffolding protein for murein synthesis (MipA/OmpV family)